MMIVWDRIIISLICFLMFDFKQVDYQVVCLFLAVVCMECVLVYFEGRKPTTIITLIVSLLMLWQPSFAAFAPLLIYECARVRQHITIPVYVMMSLITYAGMDQYGLISKGTLTLVVFMALGFLVGLRSNREDNLKKQVHDMRDEGSFLKMSNRQNREALIKQQDADIHAATLSERNRIAREIHDHVGHMLSRSILQLGAILSINKDEKLDAQLRGLKDSLDTAMNNIRESVHDLKDDSMDLEYMIRDIANQYDGLDINIDYDMSRATSRELKYCLVSIVKEALTNTVKHSDSTRVNIVMREHPALYQVLIEDNGTGSVQAAGSINGGGSSGIGLDNMRDRVSAFGGNISFSGGNGFKIFISIPKDMNN